MWVVLWFSAVFGVSGKLAASKVKEELPNLRGCRGGDALVLGLTPK